MEDTCIYTKIHKYPKMKNPTMICGLPGIGAIGKTASDYLAIELDAKQFGKVYSNKFPANVQVNEGISEFLSNEFFYSKESNMIILRGNAQPFDSVAMYELGDAIIGVAKKCGVKQMITLAAYVSGYEFKRPRVFRAGDNLNDVIDPRKFGVIKMRGGAISGLNGILIGLCNLYGIDGLCLLGETSGKEASDLRAARSLLRVLNKMLELNISFEGIDKAEELKRGFIQDVWEHEYNDNNKDDDDYMIPYG
ncbi:MAG: PAC2 family protein [Halobacteriota archaeon]|nr:PAC2 family protein [Halobacteriota archaeon]